MSEPAVDEVVDHKVQQAVARNALHKIADIVAEEQRIDVAKQRYTVWMLRYGIVLMVLLAALVARYLGVI
ncbi:MAG: hypothetical protein PHI29_06370 [Gallionella sp.]|nr:hypothetical protein [Gallionella sp.]